MHQLEAHLLQPQVVGRVIRLHPLAVILALAVGAVLAGVLSCGGRLRSRRRRSRR